MFTLKPSGRPMASLAMGAVIAAAASGAAFAEDTVSAFTGGATDYSTSGYLGATFALPGSAISRGFGIRVVGFTGGYQYQDNGPVKAGFNGGEIDAVYQLSFSGTWVNLGLGARYTDTTLNPNTITSRRKGGKTEFEVSTDGGHVSGPWRVDWYGYYGTLFDDFAVRASLTHSLTSQFRVGAEGYVEGDPTYDLEKVGPYIAFAINPKTEVQFSAGAAWETGRPDGAYVRLAGTTSF